MAFERTGGNRLRGVVIRCNPGDFGFIVTDDDRETYFSYRDVNAQHGPLVRDLVECRVESTERGPRWRARDIVILRPYDPDFEHAVRRTRAADSDYLEGLGFKDNKDFQAARKAFERAIAKGAGLPAFLALADLARDQLRDRDLALSVLEAATREYPTAPRVWLKFADLLRDAGRLSAAIEAVEKGIKQFGEPQPKLEYTIAALLAQRAQGEDLKNAALLLEKLIKHNTAPRGEPAKQILAQIRAKSTFREVIRFFQGAGFNVREIGSSTRPTTVHLGTEAPDLLESFDLDGTVLAFLYDDSITPDHVHQVVDLWHSSPLEVNRDVCLLVGKDYASVENQLLIRMERELDAIVPFSSASLPQREAERSLRTQLDRWLTQRDLFKFNRPVSGRMFFGREEELRTLARAIDDGNFAGVFGLRKVGKTSFLYQMRDRRRSDTLAYYDLQDLPIEERHTRFLLWKLGSELGQNLLRKFPDQAQHASLKLAGMRNYPTGSREADKVSRYFDEDVTTMLTVLNRAREGSRVVVLLDEIEVLLPVGRSKGVEGFHELLGYFRGLSQRTQGRFVLVVSGVNPLVNEQPRWDGRDNPLFQYLQEVPLKLLSRPECDHMLMSIGKSMGVTLSTDALAIAHDETGGHPFVARQLASHAVGRMKRVRPLQVEAKHIEDAIPSFVREKGAIFTDILTRLQEDFPDEFLILSYLAKRPHSIAEIRALGIEDPRQAMRHLTAYYLVAFDGTKYAVTIKSLVRWLIGGN